ncbi:sigma-70 family RNA polymerase sigma factor [Alteromonas sp. 5E99-2]|uniref:RNA polymerase sigma factor n=1 Tax=Alteromonas sp. 5E99-2 TaxID=2817683 RepID=UPI001A981DA1|nr:sigma-70 family RNA polymerase sigma factor [Alteromonas sp. 5E99-2]MBO1254740.1 sigma-70 family RNA polymerase sigma factor [Alteromonas sp. 5E99-2]
MDFSTVLSEHQGLLSRVANSYEADPELQKELFQEISIAVWQALRSFKQESSIKTYILRIAHNRAVSHVAKEVRTVRSNNVDNQDVTGLFQKIDCTEQKATHHQQIEHMLTAVRQLKLPARQIFTMSMEGLSYQEISDNTGLSVSNVGAIINRSKALVLKEINHD